MEKLFEFLGLVYPSEINDFIAKHTGMLVNHGRIYVQPNSEDMKSNSNKNAFLWRKDLNKVELDYIENACKVIMDKLGYAKYENVLSDSDI